MFAASLPAQVVQPYLGKVLFGNGEVRNAFGLPASALLSGVQARDVLSLGCPPQGDGCLLETPNRIISILGSTVGWSAVAPSGGALFSWSEAGTPLVFFRKTSELFRWTGTQFELLPFAPQGDVLALAPQVREGQLLYAIRQNGDTRIEALALASGSSRWIQSMGETGPVFLRSDGSVLTAGSDVTRLLLADGSSKTFPRLQAISFFSMGGNLVEAVAPDGIWVIDGEQALLLPGRENLRGTNPASVFDDIRRGRKRDRSLPEMGR